MSTKVINALSARIAKLETLLENKDAFGSGGGQSFGGLNYQGSQYGGINFGDNYFSTPELPPWEQQQAQGLDQSMFMDQLSMENFDLQQRIQSLELLVSSGSNDTRQDQPIDATQQIGDDGSSGTGTTSDAAPPAVAFCGAGQIAAGPTGTAVPFIITASLDSHNAWSGTGYSIPLDGYYLCIGDVDLSISAFPVSATIALTKTGGSTATSSTQVTQVTATDSLNTALSSAFLCGRGDVITMNYTLLSGTLSGFFNLTICRIAGP